jgi:Flp pilus assembly protein TadD
VFRVVAEGLADRNAEAEALRSLAIIASDRKDLKLADVQLQRALELQRTVRNRPGQAQTLNSQAIVAQHGGQMEKASELFEKSLQLKRQVGDREGEARTLNNLAFLQSVLGDLGRAETLLLEARAIPEAMENPQVRALVAFNLAEVYLQTGMADKAADHVSASLAYYTEEPDAVLQAARLAYLQGDYRTAVGEALRAKRLAGEAWAENWEAELQAYRDSRAAGRPRPVEWLKVS